MMKMMKLNSQVPCVPEEKLSQKHMEPRSDDGKNGTRLHHLSWTCQVARADVTVDTPRSAPQGSFFRRMVSRSPFTTKKKNAAPCSVSCKPTWTDQLLLIFKLLKLRLLAHSVFVTKHGTFSWNLRGSGRSWSASPSATVEALDWRETRSPLQKGKVSPFTLWMQILWPHFYYLLLLSALTKKQLLLNQEKQSNDTPNIGWDQSAFYCMRTTTPPPRPQPTATHRNNFVLRNLQLWILGPAIHLHRVHGWKTREASKRD